jgi:hypothetical protein
MAPISDLLVTAQPSHRRFLFTLPLGPFFADGACPERSRWAVKSFFFPAVLLLALSSTPTPQPNRPPAHTPIIQLAETPHPIYSADPNDSWNRIFYYLFSRRIHALLSSEFPDAAPFHAFDSFPGYLNLQVSSHSIERNETGDRAIDPLYPSFFVDAGVRVVLSGPAYDGLRQALQDATTETPPRPPLARAIMQNDLWSAYDILSRNRSPRENGPPDLAGHLDQLQQLLAKLMRKLALTPEEILALPDNYTAAKSRNSLPDLFGKDSGWHEVQWFRQRMHDESVDDRRAVRIFLKPARPPRNVRKFLNQLPRVQGSAADQLEAVALVTQALVVDSRGNPQPTSLTTEVQIRRFRSLDEKPLSRNEIAVYEISREQLLKDPLSGGLVPEPEDSPAYAPAAGNDYSFTSLLSTHQDWGPPVLIHLRTRCVYCHGGDDLKYIMTFGIARAPHEHVPTVRELDRQHHEAADQVAQRKIQAATWKALLKDWDAVSESH